MPENTNTPKEKEILPTEEESIDISNNKETAAVSYTLLLAPLLLLTRRDSKFIQFHSAQAFLLGIIFCILWLLGSSVEIFRYATIIVIFGCTVGFLHAIAGHKYKIPFIYEIVKDGFSPSAIWKGIKASFRFFKNIIFGVLPKKVAEKVEYHPHEKPVQELEKRVGELEDFILIEKFFMLGIKISDISAEQKTFLEKIAKKIKKSLKNSKISEEERMLTFSGSNGRVFLGNISSHSLILAHFFEKNFFEDEKTEEIFSIGNRKVVKISFPAQQE